MLSLRFIAVALVAVAARAQTPDQVLIVINKRSAVSREIGQYYMEKRLVPLANLCAINTTPGESITRETYEVEVENPIGKCPEEQ